MVTRFNARRRCTSCFPVTVDHLMTITVRSSGKLMFLHTSVILFTGVCGYGPVGVYTTLVTQPLVTPSTTVNKWSVCILLECFLVYYYIKCRCNSLKHHPVQLAPLPCMFILRHFSGEIYGICINPVNFP